MPPQQYNNQPTPQPGPQFQGGYPQQPIQGNNPMASSAPKKPSKLPAILVAVFVLTTITFGVLTINFYNQMNSYKNDYEARAAIDIEKAKKEQEVQLRAEFAEKEKEPTKTYQTTGSAASVKIVFPKTWDLYVDEDNTKGVVSSWFNENYIADVSNRENTYSLRLEYLDRPYSQVSKTFENAAKKGEVTISPYKAPNVSGGETGIILNGEVRSETTGSMVILPVRDKTLQIWTESDRYIKDFNNIVLKNLTYSP